MSETDDTDVLLLIPPDFFLVRTSESEESHLESSRTVVHKPKSCTARVIGKLVDQVHSLESRLDSLELSSTITDTSYSSIPRPKNWESDSLDSHSVDRKSFTFPRRRRRKVARKKQDLSLVSLDTLSSKAVPRLQLKEFELVSASSKPTDESPSMDGDISSIVSTPSKKNDKLLLHEIDEFLTKVEAYESPETNYRVSDASEATLTPENVIKATGDYLTQKLVSKNNSDDVKLPSGRIVPSSVLEKYIYLVRNRSGNSSNTDDTVAPSCSGPQKSQLQKSESIETPKVTEVSSSKTVVEVKSPSVRKLNFVEKQSISDVQPTSTPKKPQQSLRYVDSFKPSSNKIYERATKVLEQYKSHNFSSNHENSNRKTEGSCSDTEYRDCRTESFHRKTESNKYSKEGSTTGANSCNTGNGSRTKTYHPQNQNSSVDSNYLLKDDFKFPQMRPFVHDNKDLKNRMMETIDTELLSLSELWGDKREKGDRDKGESNKLEEERLKREHCESLIQSLQKKLLEQQERLAVAVQVDRAKDAALRRLKEAGQRLSDNLEHAESRHRAALEDLMGQVDGVRRQLQQENQKTTHFEKELYKALDLAHDYQEKCKLLSEQSQQVKETAAKEVASALETLASRDREILVLKDNCETVMRLNKQYTECSKNLEEVLAKERTQHEQTKSSLTELQSKLQSASEEMATLRRERDGMRAAVEQERARCSMLERQLCDEHRECGELSKRCESLESEVKSLREQLESQRGELRTHYQRQLEAHVLAKLREFESQLESARVELQSEATAKEAALHEALHQQMTVIEEQHKLEVSVLEEKHREEMKLYRLQLAQAGERIGLLENKLETYRRRRTQIASQLHSVMESQWRQALLILTNGQTDRQGADCDRTRDSVPSSAMDFGPSLPPLMGRACDRDGAWPPPQRERDSDSHPDGKSLSDHDLKQYVKMLLTKPPTLDGSGDADSRPPAPHGPGFDARRDEEPTSDRADRKGSKEHKRSFGAKPPWKA